MINYLIVFVQDETVSDQTIDSQYTTVTCAHIRLGHEIEIIFPDSCWPFIGNNISAVWAMFCAIFLTTQQGYSVHISHISLKYVI